MMIRCKFGVLAAALLVLLTANGALSQEITEAVTSFQKIDRLIAQGDNQQAWQLLRELPEDGQNLDEKLWRMARVQYEGAGLQRLTMTPWCAIRMPRNTPVPP